MKTLTLLLTALFTFTNFLNFTAQNDKKTVSVVVNNLSNEGTLYISLYNSEDDFNIKKPLLSKHVIVKNGKINPIIFKDLPKGKYAIICFQDMNDNQKLDFTSYMPDEPWGLSNNVVLMGPPSWDDAVFTVENDTEIDIELF